MRFLKTKLLKAKEALDKKVVPDLISLKSSKPIIEPIIEEPPAPRVVQLPIQNSSTVQHSPAGEIAKKLSQNRQKQSFGNRRQSHKRTQEGSSRATKNVVINFGKAIASFAISPLAYTYLKPLLEKENISNKEFADFVGEAKAGIGGIDSFRSLLLIGESETAQLCACKRIFAELGKVFIKYFSVNWITHGRVSHKLTYLKYRFKVLRRIQNPELFTYISEGKRR